MVSAMLNSVKLMLKEYLLQRWKYSDEYLLKLYLFHYSQLAGAGYEPLWTLLLEAYPGKHTTYKEY